MPVTAVTVPPQSLSPGPSNTAARDLRDETRSVVPHCSVTSRATPASSIPCAGVPHARIVSVAGGEELQSPGKLPELRIDASNGTMAGTGATSVPLIPSGAPAAAMMDYSSRYRGSSTVEEYREWPDAPIHWASLVLVVLVALLAIVPSIVVTVVIFADGDRNKLRVGQGYDATRSPQGDVFSADVQFKMSGDYGGSALSNFFSKTSRNDGKIGAIAFFYLAMFRYTLEWIVNTAIDPGRVAIFRILVSRHLMDPLAAFSRRTGRMHGLGQLLVNQRIPTGPRLRPVLVGAAVLGAFLWAGNAALAGVVAGFSASKPTSNGFAVNKGEKAEMLASAVLLGESKLSAGLGTRGCFPMALIEESFSDVVPRNSYIFCTNIIRTNARYIPKNVPVNESASWRVKNVTSMGVTSQSALSSTVVMPGIDNGLVLVPPKTCWKDEGTWLGFLTINPVIKAPGADPQVRFVDEANSGNFTKITEQLSSDLADTEAITWSSAAVAGVRGQIINDPCIEWLEHYGQRVASGLKMGFRRAEDPAADSNTSTLAPATFRTCLVGWMLSGIAGLLVGFVIMGVTTVYRGGRQVDEINDMAVSHALARYCAYPIQMMPPWAVLTIRAMVETLPDGSIPPRSMSEAEANQFFGFGPHDENRLQGEQIDRCQLAVCLAGDFEPSTGGRFVGRAPRISGTTGTTDEVITQRHRTRQVRTIRPAKRSSESWSSV
jgi:hypothetical protein